MGLKHKFIWSFIIISFLSFESIDGDGIRLPDQISQNDNLNHKEESLIGISQNHQQQHQELNPSVGESRRTGKDLLDLVGLGTGPNVDPYVARTNRNCLTGDLSECFKTHALNTFDDFFTRESYL